jgi:hypothetical protein
VTLIINIQYIRDVLKLSLILHWKLHTSVVIPNSFHLICTVLLNHCKKFSSNLKQIVTRSEFQIELCNMFCSMLERLLDSKLKEEESKMPVRLPSPDQYRYAGFSFTDI